MEILKQALSLMIGIFTGVRLWEWHEARIYIKEEKRRRRRKCIRMIVMKLLGPENDGGNNHRI